MKNIIERRTWNGTSTSRCRASLTLKGGRTCSSSYRWVANILFGIALWGLTSSTLLYMLCKSTYIPAYSSEWEKYEIFRVYVYMYSGIPIPMEIELVLCLRSLKTSLESDAIYKNYIVSAPLKPLLLTNDKMTKKQSN